MAVMSRADLLAVYEVPAPMCNRFVINVTNQFARLTFGEQMDDSTPMTPRVAVAIPLSELVAMRDSITGLLAQIESMGQVRN